MDENRDGGRQKRGGFQQTEVIGAIVQITGSHSRRICKSLGRYDSQE